MLFDTPASGFEAEIGKDRNRGKFEGPVTAAERDIDPGVPEADDVRPAVAGQVGEQARVPIDQPSSGLQAEISHDRDGRIAEAPVSLAERDIDPGITEPDHVRSASRRGCCATRHPPATKPKSWMASRGKSKVPSPLPSATQTP